MNYEQETNELTLTLLFPSKTKLFNSFNFFINLRSMFECSRGKLNHHSSASKQIRNETREKKNVLTVNLIVKGVSLFDKDF